MSNKDSSESENMDMVDLADEPSFQDNQKDVFLASGSAKTRGRKRIPL